MLTDASCRNLKPKKSGYKKADGYGLNLLVMPNGAKYWRFRYRYGGKEKTLALGVYPDVSLQEARNYRDSARKMLKGNIDPSEVRREEKKNRPKPAQNKKDFNLSLSAGGVLTVETASRIIHLTAAQTKALHTFLGAAYHSKNEAE